MSQPFTPTGNTVSRAATSTTANVALGTLPQGGASVRVHNAGPNTAFIEFGADSSTAAVVATSLPIPSGAIEVFSVGPGVTYMAAITGTAGFTTTVYATPGAGI